MRQAHSRHHTGLSLLHNQVARIRSSMNSSCHPARLSFPRIEPFEGSARERLSAVRRRIARFPGPFFVRLRALSSFMGVEIFYGVNARIWANPVSCSHITFFVGCSLLPPNRKSTGIRTIRTTPTLRGANQSSRTETHTPNPLLPLDLHYSIRNVHPFMVTSSTRCREFPMAQWALATARNRSGSRRALCRSYLVGWLCRRLFRGLR